MRLIGINGFKRSGKGETGSAIESIFLDHNAGSVKLLGFADKLKILAAKSLGLVDRTDAECITLMDECKEEWVVNIMKTVNECFTSETGGVFPMVYDYVWHSLTGREYLQHMGTQARNVFGADFWVDQVLPGPGRPLSHEALKARYPGSSAVALTDVRFENEAQRILDLGGEVWEVIRPGTASDGHDSEQVLPRRFITRQIDNSGDLMNLRYEVEKALGL